MSSATVRDVRGLIPVLATPFAADGSLDVPSLRRVVEFEIAAGVDGVATFGMASEAFALSTSERSVVLRTIRAATPHGMPVVAGVSATSDVTAVEQAQAAVTDGASALMVLPPSMVKPSAAQIVDFYAAVAHAAAVPIMVQDAPGATGVPLSASLLSQLSAIDGVELVKVEAPPTAPKVGAVIAAAGSALRVLSGHNALFLIEEYDRGAVGTMPACEFSDRLRPVLDAFNTGAVAEARRLFTALLPLIRFGLQSGIAWAVHKHVLVQRGIIDTAVVRAPAAPLDRMSRKHLDWILDDLQLPRYTG